MLHGFPGTPSSPAAHGALERVHGRQRLCRMPSLLPIACSLLHAKYVKRVHDWSRVRKYFQFADCLTAAGIRPAGSAVRKSCRLTVRHVTPFLNAAVRLGHVECMAAPKARVVRVDCAPKYGNPLL
jgi:hypothetical protein